MALPGPRRPSSTPINNNNNNSNNINNNNNQYHNNNDSFASVEPPPPYNPGLVPSSIFEPRIAVVLNVPKPWRPWLFFCRLLSIVPAIFWALQPALTLLVQIVPVAVPGGKRAATNLAAAGLGHADPTGLSLSGSLGGGGGGGLGDVPEVCPPSNWPPGHPEIPFPWTEMSLGLMWCGASAYLSFFFIDCLMSRWLINYTPSATIIRLLTMSITNAFLTERILTFSGGFEDPRLLLPGWVTIATTLTIAYHITQRSINIQKETSTSINIFSIASFISMVSLLAHLHYNGSNYPEKPFEPLARLVFDFVQSLAGDAALSASSNSSASSHTEL